MSQQPYEGDIAYRGGGVFGQSPGAYGGLGDAPNAPNPYLMGPLQSAILGPTPSSISGVWQNSPAYLQALASLRLGLSQQLGPLQQESHFLPRMLNLQLAQSRTNQKYATTAQQGQSAERGVSGGAETYLENRIGNQFSQQRQSAALNTQQQLAALAQQIGAARASFGQGMANAGLANQQYNMNLPPVTPSPSQQNVMNQLRAGFLSAGRNDLARMVGSPAFYSWINAESGWNPYEVSPANNQGLRNGGLFQFWFGHPWAQPYYRGGQFQMSPYQQAVMAATRFNLTPADINRYAQQIAQGQYRGWG